jgi:cytochrome c peroxidase
MTPVLWGPILKKYTWEVEMGGSGFAVVGLSLRYGLRGSLRRFVVGLSMSGVVALCLAVVPAQAQTEPKLPDLTGIVKDADWALILGKALFWDQAAGSDGMACASCHFSAGADSRIVNQLSPGFLVQPDPDLSFGAIEASFPFSLGDTAAGNPADSNYELEFLDFPFHQLAVPTDRNSAIDITTNDRVSSAGAFAHVFQKLGKKKQDVCGDASADVFHAGGLAARQVEPRNTPTVINAAFNERQFWDGRANRIFNGVNVFGRRDIANDPAARIVVLEGKKPSLVAFEVDDSSLASQAVGPPLSALEMSCDTRNFYDLAKKLLYGNYTPLGKQEVHQFDSLFGTNGPFGDLREAGGKGLSVKYKTMIRNAFDEKFWAANHSYEITPDGQLNKNKHGYTQMELNFSLFWGISIMLYEATLVTVGDEAQSDFDACAPVNPTGGGPAVCTDDLLAFSAQELQGFEVFTGFGPGGGRCTACHGGLLQSDAIVEAGDDILGVDRVNFAATAANIDGPETPALEDNGFHNIGVRPTTEDMGVGGLDPYGDPLSTSRMLIAETAGVAVSDPTGITTCAELVPAGFGVPPPLAGCGPADALPDLTSPLHRVVVDGAVKTPILRNVALTPPYFHYGGYASLELVIEFYNRGGSRRDMAVVGPNPAFTGDTSGTGPLGNLSNPVAFDIDFLLDFGRNADENVQPLNLLPGQVDALVAFLKTLTDERVRCDAAPFDHPELHLPNGHVGVDGDGDGKADDIVAIVPPVGEAGYDPAPEGDPTASLCLPNEGNLFAVGIRNRLTTPSP